MEPIPNNNATPESVWALMQENARGIEKLRKLLQQENAQGMLKVRELQQENAQGMLKVRELQQEHAQGMIELRKSQQKTDEQLEKLKLTVERTSMTADKALKGIGTIRNSIGVLVEHLMTPDLTKKFQRMGYTFTRFSRRTIISDKTKNRLAEIDMLLENGDYVLIVEVKTTLFEKHITDHIERMAVVRAHADDHRDKRRYLGAIAAPSIDEAMLNMIFDAGFFAITASEDSVEVLVPQNFTPKEW